MTNIGIICSHVLPEYKSTKRSRSPNTRQSSSLDSVELENILEKSTAGLKPAPKYTSTPFSKKLTVHVKVSNVLKKSRLVFKTLLWCERYPLSFSSDTPVNSYLNFKVVSFRNSIKSLILISFFEDSNCGKLTIRSLFQKVSILSNV